MFIYGRSRISIQGPMTSLLCVHEQLRSDINACVQRAEKDPERYMRPHMNSGMFDVASSWSMYSDTTMET